MAGGGMLEGRMVSVARGSAPPLGTAALGGGHNSCGTATTGVAARTEGGHSASVRRGASDSPSWNASQSSSVRFCSVTDTWAGIDCVIDSILLAGSAISVVGGAEKSPQSSSSDVFATVRSTSDAGAVLSEWDLVLGAIPRPMVLMPSAKLSKSCVSISELAGSRRNSCVR